MYLQDGYKLIKAEQLIAALAALNTGTITFRAFRAYLGCFELLAIREAAERSKTRLRKQPLRRFLTSELARLIDPTEQTSVCRELSRLNREGLLSFSEGAITVPDSPAHGAELHFLLGGRGTRRLIPVPRRVLRFLASCSKPALVKTIIAYLLRGLSLDKSGKIKSTGTAKVSWICKLCKISERAARSARAELIRLGWITKDTGSFQRKLNRDGAYFVINTAWNCVSKQFAPPRAEKCTKFAPPLKRPETLSDSKNQKLPETERSGFCGKERGRKPDLRNIQPEDIRKPSRLRELYEQATHAGWLGRSEANFLNFAGAAVRANRSGGNAVRIFVGIVRKGLWHHISASDEERGRAVLRLQSPRCMPIGGMGQKNTEREPKDANGHTRVECIIADTVSRLVAFEVAK